MVKNAKTKTRSKKSSNQSTRAPGATWRISESSGGPSDFPREGLIDPV